MMEEIINDSTKYIVSVWDSNFKSFVSTNLDEFDSLNDAINEAHKRIKDNPYWFGFIEEVLGITEDGGVRTKSIFRYGRMSKRHKVYELIPQISKTHKLL